VYVCLFNSGNRELLWKYTKTKHGMERVKAAHGESFKITGICLSDTIMSQCQDHVAVPIRPLV
jgi:hypothetical protein